MDSQEDTIELYVNERDSFSIQNLLTSTFLSTIYPFFILINDRSHFLFYSVLEHVEFFTLNLRSDCTKEGYHIGNFGRCFEFFRKNCSFCVNKSVGLFEFTLRIVSITYENGLKGCFFFSRVPLNF